MKKTFKNKSITIALALVLVFFAAAGFLFSRGNLLMKTVSSDRDQNKPTVSEPKLGDDGNTGVDVSKNTAEIPLSKVASISIGDVYQDKDNVVYTAKITNPSTEGTCSATFTNDISKPVTQVNKLNNGNCGPYTVPSAQFDSTGKWLLTVRYYSGDTQVVSTKGIEIR